MAANNVLWMTVLDRVGVFDWWNASSRRFQRSTYSPLSSKHQDSPLNAKDSSRGSLFASESWIEGQSFVVPKAQTRSINGHVVKEEPLLKTCIPLPAEEGVLRPMCPVIQRQPCVELGEVPSLPQPSAVRSLGSGSPNEPSSFLIMLFVGAILLISYFKKCLDRLNRGLPDPEAVEDPQRKEEPDREDQKRTLEDQAQFALVPMDGLVRASSCRNQELRDERHEFSVKLAEARRSMADQKNVISEQKGINAERDSTIKEQGGIIAEKDSKINGQQDALARLTEMLEILRQKEEEMKEKESIIARLMEEKQAATEKASALSDTRDRLTTQLEEKMQELRKATYFDKDLSRRREEQLTKQNKRLHNCTLHIKDLKAQVQGLGHVPVSPPAVGDGTAPTPSSSTVEEADPVASPVTPSAVASPTGPQSMMQSRWAEATPPTQPAAFRGKGQGRGRGGCVRGGRRP